MHFFFLFLLQKGNHHGHIAEARVCGVTVQDIPYIKTYWGFDCKEVRQALDEDPNLKLLKGRKGLTAPSERDLFSVRKAASLLVKHIIVVCPHCRYPV